MGSLTAKKRECRFEKAPSSSQSLFFGFIFMARFLNFYENCRADYLKIFLTQLNQAKLFRLEKTDKKSAI